MNKNTAGQKLTIFAFDYSTNAPKTGDAANLTAYVTIDDGTLTALTDTSATEIDATNGKGLYTFDLTQAETNGTKLVFSAKSSTANVSIVPQILYTHPANFSLTSIDGNGRLDIIKVAGTLQTAGDLAAMLTIIDDFLDTEIAQILGDTTTDIPTQIAALNNLSAAQVNAEVVDALNVDTYAQPGQGAPAATTTIRLMLSYLYKFARNKRDNDGTTSKFYNDDATTVDHKQSTGESGGTVTVGEMATGP